MNAIDTKLNYFMSKMENLKRLQMELQMADGQFNKEFNDWMKDQGLEGQKSLLEIIAHFRKKPTSDLVLPA